ncbi:MAG: hypothetical protein KF813_00940 [Trueperaceae bacterium]|nr:hypothetical protein [Trueperaceae bacterium]
MHSEKRALRKTFGILLASFGLMLALVACGGGTGPNDPSGTITVNGTITLPSGAGPSLSSLVVTTPMGSYPVSSTGQFTAEVFGGSGAELGVETAGGDLVLLGVNQGTSASISAASTAEALLYYLVGAMWLPAEHQDTVRSLLSGSPEAEALAGHLERQLQAGGNGLARADAATLAAIEEAHASLFGDAVIAGLATLGRPSTPANPAAYSAGTASDVVFTLAVQTLEPQVVEGSNILIEPAGVAQAGVQVVHNPYGPGVVALNEFRRPSALLAYEVATEDAHGVQTPVSPPVLVQQVDVPATGQLEFFNALLDVVTGGAPWSMVMSDRLNLPGRAGASRTHYQLVLLGPTVSSEVPPIMADSRFTSFHAQWDDIVLEKSMELFLDELLLPLVEVYGLGALARYDAAKLSRMRDRVRTIADTHLLGLGVYLKQGRSGYADALKFAISRLVESREFRLELMDTITEALRESDRNRTAIQAMEKRLAARASASAVAAAVQSLLVGSDVARIMLDLSDSPPAVDWSVITAPTLFAMTPDVAYVSRDSSSAQFTIMPKGNHVTGSFLYRWTTSGTHGDISDLFQDGKSFVTSSREVWYFHNSPLSIENTDVDSIIAEVFEVEEGATSLPPGAQPIARMAGTVRGNDRQIDGRIVVTYGSTPAAATYDGTTWGCAQMQFVFDAVPGAKTYTLRVQGVGGQGDPRNGNSDIRERSNPTRLIDPTANFGQAGYTGAYHGPCTWMRDGHYATPPSTLFPVYDAAKNQYRVNLFAAIQVGSVTLSGRVPLWYEWVDGATFQVSVGR